MAQQKSALQKALIGVGLASALACALFGGVVLYGGGAFSSDPEDPASIRNENWSSEDAGPVASEAQAQEVQPEPKTVEDQNGYRYGSGKVLISCDGSLDENDVRKLLQEAGVKATDIKLVSKALDANGVLLDVAYEGGEDPAGLCERLQGEDFVLTAEPDYVQTVCATDLSEEALLAREDVSAKAQELFGSAGGCSSVSVSAPVNDTYADLQWALPAVCAQDAWDHARSDGEVTVAVIDSGVDYYHADLEDNLILDPYAKNTYTGQTGTFAVYDVIGHGTHVSGIISACANNAEGVAGVSYNANILPIKVTYSTDGSVFTSDVIEALEYVVSLKCAEDSPDYLKNIKVINLSMGGYVYSSTYEAAVKRAFDAGILVLAAAGNDAKETTYYPAAYDGAFAVAALKESSGQPHGEVDASYSNYGAYVDIAAPGTAIYSTAAGGTYCYKTGTSMATAMASGVSALGFAALADGAPDYMQTPAWMQHLLSIGSVDLLESGWDSASGYGAICASTTAYMGTWRPLASASAQEIPDQEYTGSPVTPSLTLTYNGEELVEGQHYEVEYLNNTKAGTATAVARGIGAFFGEVAVTFNIVIPEAIPVPQANEDLVYTGEELVGVPAGKGYTLEGTSSAVRVGSYVATAVLNKGYVWEDGSTEDQVIEWSIHPERTVEKPGAVDGLVYDGQMQTGVALDATYGEKPYVMSGCCQATDAGAYEGKIALKPGYRWADGGTEPVSVSWSIQPCPIGVPDGISYEYTGEDQAVFDGLVGNGGMLYTWGNNGSGQLGDATTANKSRPVRVLGNVASASLGRYHSLAVAQDGSLHAWGLNSSGQLGIGSTTDRSAPTKVMGSVTHASAGRLHSAAVTADGSLCMWGDNEYGQLGNGTNAASSKPVKVMDGVTSLSLGWDHSAAVTADGSLYMWGSNSHGQLGDGTTVNRNVPVKVLDNVGSVSLGRRHSAAVTADGALYVWGSNDHGQVGNGAAEDSLLPVKVMDGVSSVSLGYYHSAAVTQDGALYTWGGNEYGQLGNGAYEDGAAPGKVLNGVSSVSLGRHHSAAVTQDGALYTWGASGSGVLGDGTTSYRCKPIKILEGIASVSLGADHSSCIVTTSWKNDTYQVSGDVMKNDAGDYMALVSPGPNYVWTDGTAEPKSVAWRIAPKAINPEDMLGKGMVYTGLRQIGVQSGTGYSLSGTLTAVNAGGYSAIASLWNSNYVWSDGTVEPKELPWSIQPVVLTASYAGEQIAWGEEPQLKVDVVGFVHGEDASTASGYSAPYIAAPDLQEGASYELTPEGGQADNYVFKYYPGTLLVGTDNIALANADITLSFQEAVYNGKVQRPSVSVSYEGSALTEGVDYQVAYDSGCKRSGAYAVTVDGMGLYEGTRTLTFKISDAKLTASHVTLSASAFVYDGGIKKPAATVKVNGVTQLKGEYTTTYWNASKSKQVAPKLVGTFYVKVQAKASANTAGAVWKKMTVNPKATASLKLTSLNNGFKATWAKRTVQVSGYQIAYRQVGTSTWKTKIITGCKTNVGSVLKLKDKKSYQVKVRTFKTAGGVKYYSAYTPAKTVKTR